MGVKGGASKQGLLRNGNAIMYVMMKTKHLFFTIVKEISLVGKFLIPLKFQIEIIILFVTNGCGIAMSWINEGGIG